MKNETFVWTMTPFTKKDLHPMFTKKTASNAKKTESREERLDKSLVIGQVAWFAFSKSAIGKISLMLLPSDEVRRQANELFLLGFAARMTLFEPIGEPLLDLVVEDTLVDAVWEDYLKSAKGKVVLDGDNYPDTPEPVLDVAKGFFRAGFKSATIAHRELVKN